MSKILTKISPISVLQSWSEIDQKNCPLIRINVIIGALPKCMIRPIRPE